MENDMRQMLLIPKRFCGVSVQKHKAMKGLKTQNLRDHMSEAELIFTALAELSTRQIARSVEATGMPENAEAGKNERNPEVPQINADKKTRKSNLRKSPSSADKKESGDQHKKYSADCADGLRQFLLRIDETGKVAVNPLFKKALAVVFPAEICFSRPISHAADVHGFAHF